MNFSPRSFPSYSFPSVPPPPPPPPVRTLAQLGDGPYKCKIHLPLLHISLDHVVSDELHLFLRVSDILTRNIVLELQQRGVLDIGSAKAGSGKGQHMLKLISAMKDIEISFDIWASRKSGQDLDFTSLMGTDYRKKSTGEVHGHFAAGHMLRGEVPLGGVFSTVRFRFCVDSRRGGFCFLQLSWTRLDCTVLCSW